jgi:hypothetical protein
LDYPVPGGNKYRNLHIVMSPEKDCAGKAQLTIENYRPDLSSERANRIKNRTCLKLIKERRRKIGRGSQMGA